LIIKLQTKFVSKENANNLRQYNLIALIN